MSNSGWTPPAPEEDRNPKDEIGKRFAEAGGGIFAAMRAIAMKDHKRMLDMHATRLCQDHRAQQMAAGFRPVEDGLDCPMEDDDMGDSFNITGDQYHYQVPTTTTTTEAKGNSIGKTLAAAAIGFLIPAVGVLGYLLAQKPEATPVEKDTDNVVVVSVE